MILSVGDIVKLIKEPFNKAMLEQAVKYHKMLIAHVYNIDLDSRFSIVDTFENQKQLELRKRYKRANKHLYTQLARPLDKVYNAKGGAKYYNLPPKQDKQFRSILSDVNGTTIQKWFENNWKDKRITDPNGLIFQEVSTDGLMTYPTYKSVTTIHDIKLNGPYVQYVIFYLGEETQGEQTLNVYRVVDDAFDYIVTRNGDVFDIDKKRTLPNYFGRVPAMLCSMQKHSYYDYHVSFFDGSVELADELLMDSSVRNIFKKRSGFPYYWQFAKVCKNCKGEGVVDGEECPVCNGLMYDNSMPDVTDITNITVTDDGKANPTPPNGYTIPPVDVWKQLNLDMDQLSRLIFEVEWGMYVYEDKDRETAMGKNIDHKVQNDRVSVFSEEAEEYEKFFTDLMGSFYFGQSYKGSTIIYGKRFLFETPDEILNRILEAKTRNAPEFIIRNQIIEYLQARYDNDSFEMSKQLKIFKIDPYPIWSLKEMKDIGFSGDDIMNKVRFLTWLNTLDANKLIFSTEEQLKTDFNNYKNALSGNSSQRQSDPQWEDVSAG